MARTPYATRTYDTPQKSGRVPAGQIGYIVIHHAASTSFDGVIALEMGAREVSSTVIIKDDQVASMFDEDYRAWSLSSQYWDSVSLSSETCNETTDPGWTISEASYRSLAKVVADWCRRYNIPCDREHIMGHREVYTRYGASYATACPGGINLDRVVSDAAAILSGSTPTVNKENNNMGLRIISDPVWRAAKQQVVHNGQAANTIPDVVALALRQGGVECHDYDDSNAFQAEISTVWMLGGLGADAAAAKVKEMLEALPQK